MDEFHEKIARLPTWVREHIKRLEALADPNNAELRLLRQRLANAEERLRKMRDRVDAITEIMVCAARGGHETAQAYVDRVVNEAEL